MGKKGNFKAVLAVVLFALVVTLSVLLAVQLLSAGSGSSENGQQETQQGETGQENISFGSEQLPVVGDVPKTTHDPALFELRDGRMVYNDPEVQTFTGIDVSAHREEIDWNAVREDGIDFAMIRAGWRGNTEGGLYQDEYFASNMAGATAAGLDVGVYLYSQAVSVEEAVEEAEAVLEWIRGYEITYPVVYDWEYVSQDARTANVDNETLNACAVAFCQTIEQAGYIPMIYFNLDIGYRRYDLSQISGYDFWLAEYDGAPTFYYDYQMLQYTCEGRVAGSEDLVDLNLCFVDYAAMSKKAAG